MLFVNKDSFTSSFSIFMPSVSFLVSVQWPDSPVQGDWEHPLLVTELRKVFSISPQTMMLAEGFAKVLFVAEYIIHSC